MAQTVNSCARMNTEYYAGVNLKIIFDHAPAMQPPIMKPPQLFVIILLVLKIAQDQELRFEVAGSLRERIVSHDFSVLSFCNVVRDDADECIRVNRRVVIRFTLVFVVSKTQTGK